MAEHAEGEGPNIDAAVFLHDVTLPGLVDDFTGRIVVRLLAVLLIAQPVAGGEQRPSSGRPAGAASKQMCVSTWGR